MYTTKKCNKCKKLKPLKEFSKGNNRKDKHAYTCKKCRKQEYQANRERILRNHKENYKSKKQEILGVKKQYYEKNREQILIKRKKHHENNREEMIKKSKRYYKNNKEKLLLGAKEYYKKNKQKILETSKKYRDSHKQEIRKAHCEYTTRKGKTDPRFNLDRRMKTTIGVSLKGNKNGWNWEILVGYDVTILKKHLNRTIPKDYSWNDYLDGKLHIDHIIPISAFNFDRPEHIDFKRCWALKNLRLLPARENLEKWAHLNKPFQPSLKL